jgi:nicotinate (nicotinamide) nucleotide adenylyltransferase
MATCSWPRRPARTAAWTRCGLYPPPSRRTNKAGRWRRDSTASRCSIELDRGGVSYTVETLTALTSPDRELFLILGSDALLDLPNWRQPERICELATLIVARRPGAGPVSLDCLAAVVPEERRRHFARHQIEMPRLDLSSSDIRRRVAAGRSIRYRTPRGVEEYIRAQGLYAAPDEPEATRLDPRRSCGG